MQLRLSTFVIVSFLVYHEAALAINLRLPSSAPINVTTLQTATGYRTLGLPEQPDSLSVTYTIGGPKLLATACLMNAVDALKTLALGDWEAKIVDGTEYRLASFPEVSISVITPKRKRNIQARYVIWAIMDGLSYMIANKLFELAQFELRWDGVVLGWVHVADNPVAASLTLGGGQTNQTVDMTKRSAEPPSTNDATNLTTTPPQTDPFAESRLTTTFTPQGGPLGIYDVFLPIMNALTDMAVFPSTHRTQGLIAGYGEFPGAVCILSLDPPGYVEYQWIIRTVARIPGYMLAHRRFGEIDIAMAVDGVDVAGGRMTDIAKCDGPSRV